jgi:hypothetical protein
LRARRPVVSRRGYIISAISDCAPAFARGSIGKISQPRRAPVITPSVAVHRNGFPGSAAHVASRSTKGRLSSTSAPTPFGPGRGLIVRQPGKACQLSGSRSRPSAFGAGTPSVVATATPASRCDQVRPISATAPCARSAASLSSARARAEGAQTGGGAGTATGRRANMPAFSARSATARIVTYAAAIRAAGSPAGLSLTSRRISQPAFWMSSCASITTRLPPAARGVAVKVSDPGEKSPSTRSTCAPSGRSWITSLPSRLNSGTSTSHSTEDNPSGVRDTSARISDGTILL